MAVLGVFPEIFCFLYSSDNTATWATFYIYYKKYTQCKLPGGGIWSHATETVQNASFHVKFRMFTTIFKNGISSSRRLYILTERNLWNFSA